VKFHTYLAYYSGTPRYGLYYDLDKKELYDYELPPIFSFPVRKDLIKRVSLAEFTARMQPQGRDPLAGKRTSADSWGAHHGVSRVPRIKGSSRAALVNMTVGGRRAHPPRTEKIIVERVNKKEKLLGTISALAATSRVELVRGRGHVFTAERLPIIVSQQVEGHIAKTKQARELLESIGLLADVLKSRASIRYRAGKGKMRGRRYKEKKSILFIVSHIASPLAMAVRNLPGVDVATGRNVSVLELAPGAEPGRLTVITEPALDQLKRRFGW